MRILMLAQFYPPIVGGEEQHVRNLSRALVMAGHDVAVATLWREGLPRFELDEGVRIYRINSTTQRATFLYSEGERTHAPPLPDPEAVLALREVVIQERPQIVHAHNWLLHSFLPLKLWSKARFVVTLHDYSLICSKKRLMLDGQICSGPGIRKCLNCAAHHYGPAVGSITTVANWTSSAAERALVDMFLAVSEATAVGNHLPQLGVPFQVIPNLIPDDITERYDDTDPRLEQLPKGDFLLFVGDISKEKGVPVLLRAYQRLTNPPPLVLIGRPCDPLPPELLKNVSVFSFWPHRAIMSAWKRCLIGFAPSVWSEPCGTVVLEAMAMGRPVVASRVGGIPDLVVEGETGFLVPAGDAEALAQAATRLLADPSLRARMGAAGRERVTQFQVGTVAARIANMYSQLIA